MSSIAMAADSTQADFVYGRLRSAAKPGVGKGHLKHTVEQSGCRHKSSKYHKQKRREFQVTKSCRRSSHYSYDDNSDHDSDLDLAKKLLPISGYVKMKDEMINHMFRSISYRKLCAMLPEILKPLNLDELKKFCMEQLEVMSKKRICRILDGADPDAISSSGTEEEDDEEKENSSRLSTDTEDGDLDIESACVEKEAADSTSLRMADNLEQKKKCTLHLLDVTEHLETNEYADKIPAKCNEFLASVKEKRRENHKVKNSGERKGNAATSGLALAIEKLFRVNSGELEGTENLQILMKPNEYSHESDGAGGEIDLSNSFTREENIKVSKRNFERSYRTKQLDDEDHEYNCDAGERMEADDCPQQRDIKLDDESLDSGIRIGHLTHEDGGLLETGNIPSCLPGLESEPEETCCPFVILDSNLCRMVQDSNDDRTTALIMPSDKLLTMQIQDVHEISGDESRRVLSTESGQETDVVVTTEHLNKAVPTELPERNEDHSLRVLEVQVGNCVTENDKREPQMKLKACYVFPASASTVESVNEGEEMIIEIQDHEFSDIGDGDEGNDKSDNISSDNNEEKQKAEETNVIKQDLEAKTDINYQVFGPVISCREEIQKTQLSSSEWVPTSEDENGQKLVLEKCSGSDKSDILWKHNVNKNERVMGCGGIKRKTNKEADDELPQKLNTVSSIKQFAHTGLNVQILGQKNVKTENTGPVDGKSMTVCGDVFEADTGLTPLSSVDTSIKFTDMQIPQKVQSSQPGFANENSSAESLGTENTCDYKQSLMECRLNRKVIADKSFHENYSSMEKNDERSEMHISSSIRREPGKVAEFLTPLEAVHSSSSNGEDARSCGTSKESAPVLSKTQLEILELEMRARAIKAMLKAQEELEKREEKLKLEEKLHSLPVSNQALRSSLPTENYRVACGEKRMMRIGSTYRGTGATARTGTGEGRTGSFVHGAVSSDTAIQCLKGNQLVRGKCQLLHDEMSHNLALSSQQALNRLAFKSYRKTTTASKFQACCLSKRPMRLPIKGRGVGGGTTSNSDDVTSRIIRLSSMPRADSRTVVSVSKVDAATMPACPKSKMSKPGFCDHKDIRRVIATGQGSQAGKIMDSSARYGRCYMEHKHPKRDQKRSVLTWNRHVTSNGQASRTGRF